MRLLLMTTFFCLLATGCTLVDPVDGGDEEVLAGVPSAPVTVAPDSGGPQDCPAADLDDMDGAIGGQLEAFARGDFAGALSFGTDGFQRSFEVEDFEEMITSQFPIAAAATSHESLACTLVQRQATVLVDVLAPIGAQTLQYLMAQQDDGTWAIEGAFPVDGESGFGQVI